MGRGGIYNDPGSVLPRLLSIGRIFLAEERLLRLMQRVWRDHQAPGTAFCELYVGVIDGIVWQVGNCMTMAFSEHSLARCCAAFPDAACEALYFRASALGYGVARGR